MREAWRKNSSRVRDNFFLSFFLFFFFLIYLYPLSSLNFVDILNKKKPHPIVVWFHLDPPILVFFFLLFNNTDENRFFIKFYSHGSFFFLSSFFPFRFLCILSVEIGCSCSVWKYELSTLSGGNINFKYIGLFNVDWELKKKEKKKQLPPLSVSTQTETKRKTERRGRPVFLTTDYSRRELNFSYVDFHFSFDRQGFEHRAANTKTLGFHRLSSLNVRFVSRQMIRLFEQFLPGCFTKL